MPPALYVYCTIGARGTCIATHNNVTLQICHITIVNISLSFNSLTAKLLNYNFHSLEIVSRWRDSQLQVSENNLNWTQLRSTMLK